MKTVIIGAGLTGLAAAYKLRGNVILLEKKSELGGLLASYKINHYFIEKYYHHFFPGDKTLINLIEEFGLKTKIVWSLAKVGYFFENKIYPLNTPFEILKFPGLSLKDKIDLTLFVLKAKRKNKAQLDNILSKDWIFENLNPRVYENFFLPLLESKFGKNKEKISAAWLASRITLRSNRGLRGEKLGYLKGGFHFLVEALAKKIKKEGGEIRIGFKVKKIEIKNDIIKGIWGEKEFLPAEKVIFTASPKDLSEILEARIFETLPKIQYQGVICLLLALKKNLLQDIYWLNIKADVPFGAIIEHTNFMPLSDYSEHLVYITAYFQDKNDFLYQISSEKIFKLFIKGIKKLFPHFNEKNIKWWRLSRHSNAAPIYEIGYKEKIFPYFASVKGLYLAGMFSESNYPERSLNGSLVTGFKIANLCQTN